MAFISDYFCWACSRFSWPNESCQKVFAGYGWIRYRSDGGRMALKAWVLALSVIASNSIPSNAEESLFYFDMGAHKAISGKPKEFSVWRGFCSTGPQPGCAIDIIDFSCKPKGTPRISGIISHSSLENSPLFEILGPIDFKKHSFDFRIAHSANELTCFIQGDNFGKQKPNLKCTGLDRNKSAILVEIIPKRSTIVDLCGNLAIDGRD